LTVSTIDRVFIDRIILPYLTGLFLDLASVGRINHRSLSIGHINLDNFKIAKQSELNYSVLERSQEGLQ